MIEIIKEWGFEIWFAKNVIYEFIFNTLNMNSAKNNINYESGKYQEQISSKKIRK